MARRPRVSTAQKKYSGAAGIEIGISMEGLLEVLAAGDSLAKVQKRGQRYIDALVDEAFEKADEQFNRNAAAYASTGAISHMYEWGTVGVNNARSNVRMNPLNQAARLWHNYAEGAGLERTIFFVYRPSMATVPKPTKAETGMSTEVIRKMRDHVFRWKAEVMEEGQDVTIAPRKAKFLLVPAYKQNRPYMRPNDIKRGYRLLMRPIRANPGNSKYYGSFTTFWTEWWMNEGTAIFDMNLQEKIVSDYEPELRSRRNFNTFRPVGTIDVRKTVASKSEKLSKKVQKKAETRKVT